jgi:hypothetical protein
MNRPKRAPGKKRKQPPIANRIVTPAPMKKRLGPVFRLGDAFGEIPRIAAPGERSAMVEPKRKRKPKVSIFGNAPDDEQEAHRRAGERAQELFREIVRRAGRNGDG